MKNIRFLIFVSIALIALSCSKVPKQPNVIFVLADDLGWRDLGCYGSDLYETPNLDAFAASGMKFSDAYAASPLCSPTRASILTGMEPGRLRFTTPSGHVEKVVLDPQESDRANPGYKAATPQTRTRLPNEYRTFAEVLEDQGYKTGFMGKWHLGRDPYIPENQGFDVVVGGREHPGPPPPGHFFAPWDCNTLPVKPAGTHICDVLTDTALGFIEANKEEPFLLCLWYYDVHAPYQGKEDLKSYYTNNIGPENKQRCPTMGAMVGNMDSNFGRLMSKLKELKIDKNTIIVFTSDNGGNMYDGPDGTTPTNNFPLRAGKGNNYEGGVRVPLIVNVPGLTKSGSESEVVVSSVDHYATILELLKIPFPETQLTDGVSYIPALKGEKDVRAPIFSTFCHYTPATGGRPSISMREGPWRFYKFYFDGPAREHRYELYNLDEDIGESINLADKMPEKVQEMLALLDQHAEDAEILLPKLNQNYAGNVADAWIGSANTQISVSDKVLKIKAEGSDPSVETVYTPNIYDATFKFEFEMRSNSSGQGILSWKLQNDADYSQYMDKDFVPVESLRSTPIKSRHDGQWHKYSIKMPLEGKLKSIKIQPSEGEGLIELRNIVLNTQDGYYIRDWPLY